MSFDFRPILRWFPAFTRLEKENERLRTQLAERTARNWPRRRRSGGDFLRRDISIRLCLRARKSPTPLSEVGSVRRFPRSRSTKPGSSPASKNFAEFYASQPFPEQPTPGRRFHLDNPSYGHYDAIMLYGMLREAKPRRIIEVGSGFSSAAMLDVNELVLVAASNLLSSIRI